MQQKYLRFSVGMNKKCTILATEQNAVSFGTNLFTYHSRLLVQQDGLENAPFHRWFAAIQYTLSKDAFSKRYSALC